MKDINQKIKEENLESHNFLESEYEEIIQDIKKMYGDIDNDKEVEDSIKVFRNGALKYKNKKRKAYINLLDKLLQDYNNSLKEFEINIENFQNPQSKTLAKKNLNALYEKVQNTFTKDKQANEKNIYKEMFQFAFSKNPTNYEAMTQHIYQIDTKKMNNFYKLLEQNDISLIRNTFINNYDEYILRELSIFQSNAEFGLFEYFKENSEDILVKNLLSIQKNYKIDDTADNAHNIETDKSNDDFWSKFIVFAIILAVIMTISSFIFSFALFTGKTFAIIVIGATIISWIL